MTQIVKRAIQNNAVDGDKIKLLNGQGFKGAKVDGSDLNLFSVDNTDSWVFHELPKYNGSELATKEYFEGELLVETSARAAGDAALDAKIEAEKVRIDAAEAAITNLQSEIEGSVGEDLEALETRITNEVATLNTRIDTEVADLEAADVALQNAISALGSGMSWRGEAFCITEDAELKAAADGALLSDVLPMGDDDEPALAEADFPVGALILSKDGANSKLFKVIDDAGVKKVELQDGSEGRLRGLVAGDSFVVTHDLMDSPSAQENRAMFNFSGEDLVKLGDIDFSVASGIDLSPEYAPAASVEAVAAGDSVEAAISKLDKQIAEIDFTPYFKKDGSVEMEGDIRFKVSEPSIQPKIVEVLDLAWGPDTENQFNWLLHVPGIHTDYLTPAYESTSEGMAAEIVNQLNGVQALIDAGFEFTLHGNGFRISGPVEYTFSYGQAGRGTATVTEIQPLGLIPGEPVRQIKGLADGTDATDAVNKGQLDAVVANAAETYVPLEEKGVQNGIATLNEYGVVPREQLGLQAWEIGYDPGENSSWGGDEPSDISYALDQLSLRTSETADNSIHIDEKGAANGVATLDANGKLTASQVPAIAISNTFVVADQAAQDAIVGAEEGDVAVRTDLNKSFIKLADGNWQELLTPTDAVQSVNGQSGTVVLGTDEIEEGANNLYFTEERAKAAVVVDSMEGAETEQAPSVQSVKDYIAAQSSDITKEIITLAAADITNGYIDLAVEASEILDVTPKGFLPQFEGDDFTVSVVAEKTRITFVGDMLSLVEGDKVKVIYAK